MSIIRIRPQSPSTVTLRAGQSLQASGLFSATDADNDTLTYNLYDNTSAANSGHFAVNVYSNIMNPVALPPGLDKVVT